MFEDLVSALSGMESALAPPPRAPSYGSVYVRMARDLFDRLERHNLDLFGAKVPRDSSERIASGTCCRSLELEQSSAVLSGGMSIDMWLDAVTAEAEMRGQFI